MVRMMALWRQWQSVFSLSAVIIIFLPTFAFAEVYLSAEEAVKKIFPDIKDYKAESYNLGGQELKVFTVITDNKIVGWSVVIEEMGKVKPIAFLVGIDSEGKVLAVYVLEYRDMFGSEIKRRSFLRQFIGKSRRDPITVGRDIDAVTGATISSGAAVTAVKNSLEVVRQIKEMKG